MFWVSTIFLNWEGTSERFCSNLTELFRLTSVPPLIYSVLGISFSALSTDNFTFFC